MKLIVACDPNGGIGYNNKLPWTNIQGDLPRFKELTTGKVVVMGRNTWESLPKKPLPNRINVVVSSTDVPGITTLNSLPEEDNMDLRDVYLIGGAKLINSSWHLIDEVHLTRTFSEYTCDTFIDLLKLQREFMCWFKENHIDHTYEIWKRK
jgi:dihydrofolate reductase